MQKLPLQRTAEVATACCLLHFSNCSVRMLVACTRAGWRQDEHLEAASRGLSMSDDGSPGAAARRAADLRPPAPTLGPFQADQRPPEALPTTPNPLAAARHASTGSSSRGSPRTPTRNPSNPGTPSQARGGEAGVLQHDRVALQLGRGYK